MQEPSDIEKKYMSIINNTAREALWNRGYTAEDHQIRSGNWNPSVKANEKKKKSFGYIIVYIIQIHDHDGPCIIYELDCISVQYLIWNIEIRFSHTHDW